MRGSILASRTPISPPPRQSPLSHFFFFNDTATTEIYTLSLHDALPIYFGQHHFANNHVLAFHRALELGGGYLAMDRSEEHTSELQSLTNLVCRLLLEKQKYGQCFPSRPACGQASPGHDQRLSYGPHPTN